MPEIDARDGQDSSPRATVPDSRLRLVIGLKLDDAELAIEELSYSVTDQRVTLRGEAEAMIQRDRAELIVRSIEGVRGVDNRIEVGR
jgi:osmotically-inducible protein OsmY